MRGHFNEICLKGSGKRKRKSLHSNHRTRATVINGHAKINATRLLLISNRPEFSRQFKIEIFVNSRILTVT
jgi:hypothetical protein